MSEPEITVKRMSHVMPYSRAMAEDYPDMRGALANLFDPSRPTPPPPVDPGPHVGYLRLVEAVATDLLLAELVELHSAKWLGYGGSYQCAGDHYGDDWTTWPCDTVDVIARHRGVEL